jgi:hypothetical protein
MSLPIIRSALGHDFRHALRRALRHITHVSLNRRSPAFLGLKLSLMGALLAVGCAQPTETKKPKLQASAPSTVQAFDLNGDGKPDAWRHYKRVKGEKVLTLKEFDFNFDGRKDLKRHYNDEGQVERDEMDMDFDGRVDMVSHYQDNRLVRKELSTRGDEKPEVFKEYKDGELYYLEGDKDGDGTLDMWSYFKKGKMVRQGVDNNGDGKPDHWIPFE